jgi:hypothetical protein
MIGLASVIRRFRRVAAVTERRLAASENPSDRPAAAQKLGDTATVRNWLRPT